MMICVNRDKDRYPDLEAAGSLAHLALVLLPLVGLAALRHMVLLLTETQTPFQLLHISSDPTVLFN